MRRSVRLSPFPLVVTSLRMMRDLDERPLRMRFLWPRRCLPSLRKFACWLTSLYDSLTLDTPKCNFFF